MTGQGGRHGLSVGGLEDQRRHVAAFRDLARHAKGAESAPGGSWARRRSKPGVSRGLVVLLLLEQRLEGTLPAAAQRRNSQRALKAFARMRRHVKQRIDLEHAHALGPALRPA